MHLLYHLCSDTRLSEVYQVVRIKKICIDISLCIVTRLQAGRSWFWGSIPGGGWEFFSSPPCAERLWGPPRVLFNRFQEFLPWEPGREANHSPPSNVEVKECVELYLHSPVRLHGVVLSLNKAQGQLYLYQLYNVGVIELM
jgi:hypothetical protein